MFCVIAGLKIHIKIAIYFFIDLYAWKVPTMLQMFY